MFPCGSQRVPQVLSLFPSCSHGVLKRFLKSWICSHRVLKGFPKFYLLRQLRHKLYSSQKRCNFLKKQKIHQINKNLWRKILNLQEFELFCWNEKFQS
jgi:hypothetical protein